MMKRQVVIGGKCDGQAVFIEQGRREWIVPIPIDASDGRHLVAPILHGNDFHAEPLYTKERYTARLIRGRLREHVVYVADSVDDDTAIELLIAGYSAAVKREPAHV